MWVERGPEYSRFSSKGVHLTGVASKYVVRACLHEDTYIYGYYMYIDWKYEDNKYLLGKLITKLQAENNNQIFMAGNKILSMKRENWTN